MSIAKSERERPLLHAPVYAALYCGACASLLFSVIACLPSLDCRQCSALWPVADKKPRMIFSPIHYHAACRPGTCRERSIGYTSDYAAHAKVLAMYKGLGPVKTLHKPVEVGALRAALGSEES